MGIRSAPALFSSLARGSGRWLALFAAARVVATGVAVVLLMAHRVTDHDELLIAIVLPYGAVTTAGALLLEGVRRLPAAWAADAAAILTLVAASQHWRSPFYLLALTALILPSTTLPFWRAVGFTSTFMAAYFVIATATGIDWGTLESTTRLESFASHLLLPLLVGVALAYSSRLLARLEAERRRSEQLALEAERRRIARDLHDSAKQRVHAAHLVLSFMRRGNGDGRRAGIEQAIAELEAATAEMDASLHELRLPSGEGALEQALRRRASQLEAASGIPIRVTGSGTPLPAAVAAHVFHVLTEAMTNAVRHAGASRVEATLSLGGGHLAATVADDGRGLPPGAAERSHGIRSMTERAELVGGTLTIGPSQDGPGTRVLLEVPLGPAATEPA